MNALFEVLTDSDLRAVPEFCDEAGKFVWKVAVSLGYGEQATEKVWCVRTDPGLVFASYPYGRIYGPVESPRAVVTRLRDYLERGGGRR